MAARPPGSLVHHSIVCNAALRVLLRWSKNTAVPAHVRFFERDSRSRELLSPERIGHEQQSTRQQQ